MKLKLLSFLSIFLFSYVNLISAPLTPGNIVILRIGEIGSMTALSSAAFPVFLDEYTTNGVFVQTIALPTSVVGEDYRLVNNGTATANGYITTSADGRFIVVCGFDANVGTINVSSTAGINRTLGFVDLLGNVNTKNIINNGYTTDNIRSVTSFDGNEFWASGAGSSGSGGVRYIEENGLGVSTQISATVTNTRNIRIFNNQLYITSASGSFRGIAKVGTGLPTTSGQTITQLPGFPTSGSHSPYDFSINSTETIAYVADDRTKANGGGIQKWTFSGGTWSLAYTLDSSLTSGCRGIVVDWSGVNPIIYATTAESSLNKLVKVTDTDSNSSFTTLTTATTNTIFRGITFAPNSVTLTTNTTLPAGTYEEIDINNCEVNLSGNVVVTGGLILNNGAILNTGANNISFTSVADDIIESPINGRIIGTAIMLPRNVGTGAFPQYLGVSLNAGLDNIGNLSITRVTGPSGIITVMPNSGIAANWSITSDFVPSSGRDLTLSFLSNFDNGKDLTQATVWRSNGFDWQQIGGVTDISMSNPRNITRTITGFSSWTISDNGSPLPVELDGFVASTIKNEVILDWVTSNELNNSHFVVERVKLTGNINKYNAIYTELGSVVGSGNSNTIKRYKYVDKNVPSGKYAYRLKQVDYNGNYQVFVMEADVIVGTPAKFNLSQNYPNPFNPSTKFNFELPVDANVELKIYDINGREVATLINESKQAGYYTEVFNGSGLASGIYFAKLVAGSFVDVKKITLVK